MNDAFSTTIRHCRELAARETDTEPKSQKAQRRGLAQICAKETGVHTAGAGVADFYCAASMQREYEEQISGICRMS
jgi:hypothetical protein